MYSAKIFAGLCAWTLMIFTALYFLDKKYQSEDELCPEIELFQEWGDEEIHLEDI